MAQWKPASSSKVAPEPTKVQQSSKEKKSTIEKALNPTSKAASPIENKSIEEEEDRDEAYEKILESLQAEREEVWFYDPLYPTVSRVLPATHSYFE